MLIGLILNCVKKTPYNLSYDKLFLLSLLLWHNNCDIIINQIQLVQIKWRMLYTLFIRHTKLCFVVPFPRCFYKIFSTYMSKVYNRWTENKHLKKSYSQCRRIFFFLFKESQKLAIIFFIRQEFKNLKKIPLIKFF